jgi:leucyl-tRNA synthetase
MSSERRKPYPFDLLDAKWQAHSDEHRISDDIVCEYGADALRCYRMFIGSPEQTGPWSMAGVEGISRFLARIWRLVMEENQAGEWVLSAAVKDVPPAKSQTRVLHATIKKVGEDIQSRAFNTAISQLMIFVNAFTNTELRPVSAMRVLLVLLGPFAPHLAEELWAQLAGASAGFAGRAADQAWPEYDPRLLIDDEVEIVLQVNGRVRDRLIVPRDATPAQVEAAALASPRLRELTAGKEIKKFVVVPGKLVNVVAP